MIKNLIKAIHSDDTLESMKQFESIWNQKVSDALQAKRVQVGREIFGESVEEPEGSIIEESFVVHNTKTGKIHKWDIKNIATANKHVEKLGGGDVIVSSKEYWHDHYNPSNPQADKRFNKGTNESVELVLSEELLTEATRPSNLEAGKTYIMHDGPHKDPVRFNGWTGDDEKHSESVKYKSFKDIPGVKSLKDIEDKHDAKIREHGMKDGYGKQHYAHLTALKKDGSDDYHFQAYVHKGKLRVGTGANHATFHDHGDK